MKISILKHSAIVICFLLLTLPSGCQTDIGKQGSELTQQQEKAEEIFWNIVRANGRAYPDNLAPQLIFTDNFDIALWVSPNKIYVENRFSSLCFAEFGENTPDVIAAVFGHELTHYFEQHDIDDYGFVDRNNQEIAKIMNFMNVNKSNLNKTEIKEGERTIRRIMEAQADRRGLFFAYIAGYNSFDYFPLLIENIYKWYNQSDKDLEWAYFSKARRKAIANNQIAELNKLTPIFDAGILLLATKKYELAAQCFDFIASEFPSREIYNNAGLARLLEVNNMLLVSEVPNYEGVKLELPFYLSTTSRLSEKDVFEKGDRSISNAEEKIRTLLNLSKENFNKAIAIAPEYIPAQINLCCLYLIDDKISKAKEQIEEMYKYVDCERDSININNLEALILIEEEKYSESKNILNTYRNSSSVSAINYSILEGNDIKKTESKNKGNISIMISGNRFSDAMFFHYDIVNLSPFEEETPIEIGKYSPADDWYALLIQDVGKSKLYHYLIANKNYKGLTGEKIKIGSDRESLINTIGMPECEFIISSGKILVYYTIGLALKTDNNNLVSSIVLF